MNLMIDLYAGLGGASKAFLDADDWTVLQFDNNPNLLEHNPNLIMIDLSNKYNIYNILMLENLSKYDKIVIWASPPCLEFSLAYNAPGPRANREGRIFNPDITHMLNSKWIIDIINQIHPNCTWVIENVKGAISHFEPHLGKPRQCVNAFIMWGNFVHLNLDDETKNHKKPDPTPGPMRSNIRAKVPLGISKALLDYVKTQKRLTSYR